MLGDREVERHPGRCCRAGAVSVSVSVAGVVAGGLIIEAAVRALRHREPPTIAILNPFKASDKRVSDDKSGSNERGDSFHRSCFSHEMTFLVCAFAGDLRAQAVSSLREEISAILSVAATGDEVAIVLESAGGTTTIIGNKIEDVHVNAGDQLHFITWGGGGWGDALDRDAALVGKEIRQGLVSVEGALSYGVIASANGTIDTAATDKLRADLRASRPALELFNYGPPLAELRAACQHDTGLPAPIQPVWSLAQAAE